MISRSLGNLREPYVRGPHIRYFFISVTIAFLTAFMAVVGLVSLLRLFVPVG